MDLHLLEWTGAAVLYILGGVGSSIGTFLLTEDVLDDLTLGQRRTFLGVSLVLWPLHVVAFGWLMITALMAQLLMPRLRRARHGRTTR